MGSGPNLHSYSSVFRSFEVFRESRGLFFSCFEIRGIGLSKQFKSNKCKIKNGTAAALPVALALGEGTGRSVTWCATLKTRSTIEATHFR